MTIAQMNFSPGDSKRIIKQKQLHRIYKTKEPL